MVAFLRSVGAQALRGGTTKNTFFLILYEMGMEDKDVRRIMGITQEAIRIPEQARLPVAFPQGTGVSRMGKGKGQFFI